MSRVKPLAEIIRPDSDFFSGEEDSEADDVVLVQSADDPWMLLRRHDNRSKSPPLTRSSVILSTESFLRLPRIKSISLLNFKEESSHMPDCNSSSEVKVEAVDVGLVQAPARPRSTESFTWLPRIKSISPLVDFKEGSSHMLVKKEEEKEEVATADVGSVQSAHYQLYIDCLRDLNSLPLNFKEGSSHMPDCNSSSEVKVEADDVGLVQSPYRPLSTESFTWLPRIKSISPLVHFKEGSSHMRRDEVIQETNVGSGTEILLKHLPSGTFAGQQAVDTRLVLLQEREQQLREREQQLQEREQLRERELREREQQLQEREQQLRERQQLREQQLRKQEQQLRELQEREQLRERKRKRKRKLPDSKSLLYNFKEGSSGILYIDCLRDLNSLPLNFKEESSHMLDFDYSSEEEEEKKESNKRTDDF